MAGRDCATCKGGGPRRPRISARMSGRAASWGGYPLASYPGCTDLYSGPREGDSIFVVLRGFEGERLFKRSQLGEMQEYAKETRSTPEGLPTTAVCRQAIIDLFGDAPSE